MSPMVIVDTGALILILVLVLVLKGLYLIELFWLEYPQIQEGESVPSEQ
ncbi:hypothetical protein [Legionella moravica]|nr:hypothetical protein [Legionella moravica]